MWLILNHTQICLGVLAAIFNRKSFSFINFMKRNTAGTYISAIRYVFIEKFHEHSSLATTCKVLAFMAFPVVMYNVSKLSDAAPDVFS